jgi:hypothetical protein
LQVLPAPDNGWHTLQGQHTSMLSTTHALSNCWSACWAIRHHQCTSVRLHVDQQPQHSPGQQVLLRVLPHSAEVCLVVLQPRSSKYTLVR